jgi:hypothetical protein
MVEVTRPSRKPQCPEASAYVLANDASSIDGKHLPESPPNSQDTLATHDSNNIKNGIYPPITLVSASSTDIAFGGGEAVPTMEQQAQNTHPDGTIKSIIASSAQDQKLLRFLQESSLNLLPRALGELQSGVDPETQKEMVHLMQGFSAGLNDEATHHIFGPVSQSAYSVLLTWLEKEALPQASKDIRELNLVVADLPKDVSVTKGQPNGVVTDSYSLGIQTDHLPTLKDLKTLTHAYEWYDAASKKIQEEKCARYIGDSKNGLPSGWMAGRIEHPDEWRRSAMAMLDLAVRTRNYVEAMDFFKAAACHQDFPGDFPPGTKLERNTDGTIKTLHLDLPQGLNQESPENQIKIARLRRWLDQFGPQIDQVKHDYDQQAKNPDAFISWGDDEIHGLKAKFDENNRFVALVDPKDASDLKPGQTLRDLNLLESRFKVSEKDGKIIVQQNIQAQAVPHFTGYQNLIYENIGAPLQITRTYDHADDFVTIRNGRRIEIVKASDLQNYKEGQETLHYGGKAITGALDASMLISGTFEVAAAVKALRLAADAAASASTLTAQEALTGGLLGSMRVTAGATGLSNSAGARDTTIGAEINKYRNYFFLADMTRGLINSGRSAVGLADSSNSIAAKLDRVIQGKGADGNQIDQALSGSQIHAVSTRIAGLTEYGYAPLAAVGLNETLINRTMAAYAIPQGSEALGTGRGSQTDGKRLEPLISQPSSLPDSLESYGVALGEGKSDRVRTEIHQIIAASKQALAPGASEAEAAGLKQQLIEKLTFSSGEWMMLEQYNGGPFRAEQISMLFDPNQRQNFKPEVQEQVQFLLQQKDTDVQSAALAALAALPPSPQNQSVAGRIDVAVPSYVQFGSIVRAHTIAVPITNMELNKRLYSEFERPLPSKSRLALANVMVSSRNLPLRSYAAVVETILASPDATTADKVEALNGKAGIDAGAVLDGLVEQEADENSTRTSEVDRARGQNFGVTAADFLQALTNCANNDRDPKVRALAKSILADAQIISADQ